MCRKIVRKTLILVIQGYQKIISPLFPPRCRFNPSCSQYAKKACETMSLPRAFWYIARRILRCHPLSKGGYDPLPFVKQEESHEL